ncbi:hypothetical protein M9H77_15816 [Catharanthus roseus]|uniref:Uncharacterized protein n=1 Tax=Catharanthus roseus TaxID=4058 RepID=A0ACC0B149_CATRO|nr:hypothetical protein M9H77_15816 [Catharanthus roseus]
MVRLSGRRGDDDLGPASDRTGRVEGRTVTASSRVHRVRLSNHHIYRLGLILLSHHSPDTPVPYDTYGFSHPPSQPPPALYDPYVHGHSVRPHIPYRSKVQGPMNEFSGPGKKLGRASGDFGFEGDRGLDPEPAVVRSLYIDRIDVERVHGDDVDDDDDDDSDEDGDEEEHVPMALVGIASSSGDRPRPEKEKGLIGSFTSVMRPAEGDPIDPELIPSYGGNSDLGIMYTGGGINGQEFFDVATDPQSRLSSSDRAACYIQGFAWGAATLAYSCRNLGQASRVDAKELVGCWSLLEPEYDRDGKHLFYGCASHHVRTITNCHLWPFACLLI